MTDEILGVEVDREFFKIIEEWERCCDELRELSRPRHRLDTTDEWLANFYQCVEESLRIVERLGDQTDLLDQRIDPDLIRRAMAAHINTKIED